MKPLLAKSGFKEIGFGIEPKNAEDFEFLDEFVGGMHYHLFDNAPRVNNLRRVKGGNGGVMFTRQAMKRMKEVLRKEADGGVRLRQDAGYGPADLKRIGEIIKLQPTARVYLLEK